jgi:hypothetical protein
MVDGEMADIAYNHYAHAPWFSLLRKYESAVLLIVSRLGFNTRNHIRTEVNICEKVYSEMAPRCASRD